MFTCKAFLQYIPSTTCIQVHELLEKKQINRLKFNKIKTNTSVTDQEV